jgi:hypothetical protein
VLTGLGGDDILRGGDGNDTLRPGGVGNDFSFGDAGDDLIIIPDASFDTISGGSGQDTLRLEGGFTLDLGNTINPAATISGLETIDLDTSSGNTLLATLSDVVNLSSDINIDLNSAAASQIPGTTISATDSLLIEGNGSDNVTLTTGGAAGGWVDTTQSVTINSETYEVYNYVDGASILATVGVDDNINTTI